MSHCPYLVLETNGTNTENDHHYCTANGLRVKRDEIEHKCACSYEDKYINCDDYKEKSE